MSEENVRITRRKLRSPRSAAIAGIIYSILTMAGMALMFNIGTVVPADVDREWLESWFGTVSLVLASVPFAGIAFLWFTGVIRDRIGEHEDHFFATIYLGSSIIIVVMSFIWAAVAGAIFATYAAAAELSVSIRGMGAFGYRPLA